MLSLRCLLLVLLSSVSFVLADEPRDFDPAFYPFENGVRYPTVAGGAADLKEMGYEGVGSVHGDLLEAFLKEFEAVDLKVFSVYVGGTIEAESFSYAESVTKAIRMLKGRDTLVELYLQRGKGATEEQAVAFVREIAAESERSGLRVVIYPHSNFYVETVGDAVRVAKASGCKNVGVAFNLCHFLKVEPKSDLRATLESAKPLLWSVSVCGADVGGTGWKSLIQPMDVGSYDQVALLKLLNEIGYTGDVGLQCYGIEIPSKKHLRRSLGAWRKNLAASVAD
jgi:sugar phosphate isomerase/epimerase